MSRPRYVSCRVNLACGASGFSGPSPDTAVRASLAEVIERDLEALGRTGTDLHELPPHADFNQCAGVAYTLHNPYSVLENSFDQISRSFENHVVDREQWQRELMLKMFLEIPGVRPAVLPLELRPLLNELRSFGHEFRHSYDFQLDPVRLNRLVAACRRRTAAVITAWRALVAWLCGKRLLNPGSRDGAKSVRP
jgi:hypothetical protein